MQRILVFLVIILSFGSPLSAQYYLNGQSPYFTNWQQIETPDFKLIFPSEIEPLALQYANYFEAIYKVGGNTIGHKPCKIPIVIHNRTAYSNGEVAWAPKRMNLYSTSAQTNYYEPFQQHLALHEFRHVAQIDKLNQKGTRFLYFIFGEQAIGAMLGWHVPRWFLEGDAVAYETGATGSGRGRIPDFTMKLETQLCEVGPYSYPKAMFGSYKHNVPNHYELGYFLSAMPRKLYGATIWDSVLNVVAATPLHPNPFSKGLKNMTGLPERKLYKLVMDSVLNVKRHYQTQGEPAKSITVSKGDPSNYYAPVVIGQKIVTYKTSFGRVPRFVLVEASGTEKTIVKTGAMLDPTFSYHDSVMVWNEHKNTRWGNVSYNRIAKYNLVTNTFEYLTKKERCYGSKISADLTKIVSVEANEALQWAITIRDANTGNKLWAMEFDSVQPTHPTWGANNNEIWFIGIGQQGKSIGRLDVDSGQIDWILKDAPNDFNYLRFYGSYLTVLGIYNKATNLLKYDFASQEWEVLTDVANGAGEADIMGDSIFFSNYSQSGYQLAKVPVPKRTTKFDPQNWHNPALAERLWQQEVQIPFTGINDSLKHYNITRYRRGRDAINLHSWAPMAINVDNTEIGLGATLMSQNVLSTMALVAGYQYYNAEKRHELFAELNYYGFYPELSSSLRYDFYDDSVSIKGKLYRQHYQKSRWVNGLAVPINFDYRYWFRLLQPDVSYELSNVYAGEGNQVKLIDQTIHSFAYGLYFHNLRRSAYRDLQPKWGQVFRVTYSHTPFDLDQYGELLSASADLYFPSFLNNHGIRIYAGWQQKDKGNQLYYSDRVRYPYGYAKVDNTQMAALHAFYVLPLLYPDLNAWEWLYIKRFKASVFYQQNQYVNGSTTRNLLQSAGVDLTMDCHVLRFVFPFNVGVRYARMLTNDENYMQFLFSMNF